MLAFLSGVLRDEGGYDFKRAVVEAIFDMINRVSECKEQALSHLCEFIEDCEFTKLSRPHSTSPGLEGPKSPQPAKFIRFIYNRVVPGECYCSSRCCLQFGEIRRQFI